MSAMQNVEKSQISLKVPKLKLKLTQPFQNPVESEQSSTESDSDSENENDDDDEENVPHEQSNTSIDGDLNGKVMELEQLPFSEHNVEVQQYTYNTNTSNCLTNAINNNNESLNESGSSAKNISTDSDGKSECVDDTYQTQQHLSEPLQNEFSQLNQLQNLPSIPDIQPIQEQTENMAQANVATDTIIKINVRFSQSKSFSEASH